MTSKSNDEFQSTNLNSNSQHKPHIVPFGHPYSCTPILLNLFDQDPSPNYHQVTQIMSLTSLQRKQITSWFWRKRKESLQSSSSPSTSSPPFHQSQQPTSSEPSHSSPPTKLKQSKSRLIRCKLRSHSNSRLRSTSNSHHRSRSSIGKLKSKGDFDFKRKEDEEGFESDQFQHDLTCSGSRDLNQSIRVKSDSTDSRDLNPSIRLKSHSTSSRDLNQSIRVKSDVEKRKNSIERMRNILRPTRVMSSNHRTTLELSQMSPFDSGNEEDLMRLEDFQNIEDHQEFDLGDVGHLQDHQSRSENEVAEEEEEEEEEEDFIKDYSNELNSSSIFNFDDLNSSSAGGSCSSSINHEIINLGSIEEVVEEDPVLFSTPYQPFWRRWESMFRTLSSGSR